MFEKIFLIYGKPFLMNMNYRLSKSIFDHMFSNDCHEKHVFFLIQIVSDGNEFTNESDCFCIVQ